ncbi:MULTISPECIES: spore germination protein GerW family protein [unclassified Isoptericola]|uniref:spore germination protein GerW family protein n=1 Tax=unclassified Isoptericola TaxID=2623355 RepID=UPI0027124679|nr:MULTISPECIES: spore germination protein GerW family protein [unclassified Isoptericola]MDO8145312.1 spore germination protein GerW family protein [Isoptericola sp. 178]MDO8151107.1 spore germination protein GerW family protein [Isoptericola sp. b408]
MSEKRTFGPDLARLTDAADQSFTVRRAFGEAYEHDGQLVIPVARVRGGVGTGSGGGAGPVSHAEDDASDVPDGAHDEASGEGGGGGGGYGLRVTPLGVYVVGATGTRWQPVLDLNKVILGGQIVGIVIALATGWAIGRRR